MPSDLSQLGLGAGASVASGLRLYGTVAALGFLHRIGALHLPDRLQVLSQTPILVLTTTLFLVEFLADKIPVVDTVWDAVHTFIRVPAAAVLGFGIFQDVAEPWLYESVKRLFARFRRGAPASGPGGSIATRPFGPGAGPAGLQE